ncbi:TrbC/VirB2 family protein [Listeria aquatica]|uniref:TrbC/VIRB2 family protein n=1 Tax=Listeria aquatica FSL S10-1188 TaxID=1265818 RepID=W7ATS3_9LIST|nr:TrbC/VirB2 family protein [Listeria aquatica]EUJ16600.1 hypothetical protein MAQA_15726 [Listeria aquatica FSL S10-1188]
MTKLNELVFEIYTRMTAMDWFANVTKAIQSLTGKIQPLLIVVAGLCLVCAGAMYLFGDEQKRTAKSWLIGIGIGLLIVCGATQLINTYTSITKF